MEDEAFLGLCRFQGYDETVFSRFRKAIDFMREHGGKKIRLAGDTHFDHGIRVAAILAESKVDPEIVVAGILHDILRSTSEEKLKDEFGEEILSLIRGLTELDEVKRKSISNNVETVRRILVTTLSDVRVILLKLANKLDNLRSVHIFPHEDQEKIAQEVLEIYGPLAYRLGMEKMKVQLENIAFKIIHPKKYEEISNFLEQSNEQREKEIDEAIKLMKEVTDERIQVVKLSGRPKHIYSIYKKLTSQKKSLDKQYDLSGIRFIVPEIKDCYALLGLLHERFEPMEGRLKDYIANPKPNFYRSIHTGVQLPNGKICEVQIRTPEMDVFAEEGVAAHWRYKGIKSDEFFEKRISWLKGVLEIQKDNKEFLEAAKIDVFGDKVHCYTPAGDLKELPEGATILDFAYLVHEEVGNKAVGARVNGKFVPLRRKLSKGDVVEIVTNKNQRPRRSWIKIVRSGRARQKIRKSLREHEKGMAPFHFRLIKPLLSEEHGMLVEAESFPKAVCTLAKCCDSIPGDDIVGILTKRRVISVHRNDCRAALKEEERWIPVNWRETFTEKIKFSVRAGERSGLLADLLHTIATASFEVKEAKAKLIDAENAECSFLVIPRTLDELQNLIGRVQNVSGVRKIYFE